MLGHFRPRSFYGRVVIPALSELIPVLQVGAPRLSNRPEHAPSLRCDEDQNPWSFGRTRPENPPALDA